MTSRQLGRYGGRSQEGSSRGWGIAPVSQAPHTTSGTLEKPLPHSLNPSGGKSDLMVAGWGKGCCSGDLSQIYGKKAHIMGGKGVSGRARKGPSILFGYTILTGCQYLLVYRHPALQHASSRKAPRSSPHTPASLPHHQTVPTSLSAMPPCRTPLPPRIWHQGLSGPKASRAEWQICPYHILEYRICPYPIHHYPRVSAASLQPSLLQHRCRAEHPQ